MIKTQNILYNKFKMKDNEKLLKYLEDPHFAVFEVLSEISENLPTYKKLIEIVDGMEKIRGEKGDKGDAGDTPIRGKHYFTPEDEKIFNDKIVEQLKGVIKGEKGNDGERGATGKTPIKGLDFFTEQDIEDLLKRATPKKGKHYFDGEQGKQGLNGKDADEKKIIKAVQEYVDKNGLKVEDVIKELKNPKSKHRLGVEHIYNMPNKGFLDQRWHGGGNIVEYIDLSSQLNGVLKTFTIPSASKVILLVGTEFPIIYRPTIDFTFTKNTIILTSQVSAPLKGQTLTALYAKTSL